MLEYCLPGGCLSPRARSRFQGRSGVGEWDGICRTYLRRQTVHMHLAPCARLDEGLREARGSGIGRWRAPKEPLGMAQRVWGREERECECV